MPPSPPPPPRHVSSSPNVLLATAPLALASLASLVSLASALLGCDAGAVDEAEGSIVIVGRSPKAPAASLDAEVAGALGQSAAVVDLSGALVTEGGEPIVGRRVLVYDAEGHRHDGATDARGAFTIERVTVPYDLAVTSGSEGAGLLTPTLFMGLSRPDPHVRLFEPSGPSLRPKSQGVRLAVVPPPCAAGTCSISVASRSSGGRSSSEFPYEGDPGPVVLTIEHSWDEPLVAPGERVAVHVLVADAARTSFAYGRDEVAAASGEITDLGVMPIGTVASSAPVGLRVRPHPALAGFREHLAAGIELGDGARLPLGATWAPYALVQVPRLSDATLHVTAWLEPPAPSSQASSHSSIRVRSGARPASAGELAFDVGPPPIFVSPSEEQGGPLSLRGGSVAWDNLGHDRRLTELTLSSVRDRCVLYRVWTMENEITFGWLERLGVAAPPLGAHVLRLASSIEATTDDLTAPSSTRFDDELRSTWYRRLPVEVVP